MEKDDNVWNDKSSDDFLRYLKFEYFFFNFFLAKLLCEIQIGFTGAGYFGDRDGVIKTMFIICICYTALQLISAMILVWSGESILSDGEDKIQGENKTWKLIRNIMIAITLGVMIALLVLFNNNDLTKKNKIAQNWIKVEILLYIVEMPFMALQIMLMKMRQ